MKSSTADEIKAEATRALLTCHCGHTQTDHVHSLREGCPIGSWGWCMTDGCRCQAFHSLLRWNEKRDMDRELDRKVEAQTLAAVLRNQQLPSNATTPALKYEAGRSPKLKRGQKRDKERTRSAYNASVSGIYHGTATKKPNGKYAWEEL